MKFIFAAPSIDDLIRLLRAWRFWVLAGLAGALMGAALYYIAPPLYRARATVNVDFHMEQAWPQNTDREQFYYLEREARKLEEVAMSDATLASVTGTVPGTTIPELRGGELILSQPGNGGWHFFADDRDPQQATALASAWAKAFAAQVKLQVVSGAGGLEQYITADPTQVDGLVAHRVVSLGIYVLGGALILAAAASLVTLLVRRAS